MNTYQDYTLDELLDELVQAAWINSADIENLKAEIKKRFAPLEAHQK